MTSVTFDIAEIQMQQSASHDGVEDGFKVKPHRTQEYLRGWQGMPPEG